MADPVSYRPKPGEIPVDPGVYRFRDKDGRVIYVGKAKSLRPRLSSYFQDIHALHPRTATMVRTGASVEWTVVATEVEALQLEYSWIKEFDPRFNVKYRDDKSYPFLAVTLGRGVPPRPGDARRQAQGHPLLRPVQPRLGDPGDPRPAPARLPDAHVQHRRLQARPPERPAVPARLHRQVLGALRGPGRPRGAPADRRGLLRLHGRQHDQVHQAASSGRCARRPTRRSTSVAARLRDDLGALNKALEKNAVVLADKTDADVFALADDELEAAVQVFFVRGGRIRGQRGWVVEKESEDVPELMGHLLQQVYGDQAQDSPDQVPREVLVPIVPAESEALAAWLGTLRGHRVDLRVPQRGDKRPLMETVRRNAEQSPGAAQGGPRRRPHHAQPGPPGAAGRPRAARRAAADRVLRRQPRPGHQRRRLDGGLRGRAGRASPSTAGSSCAATTRRPRSTAPRPSTTPRRCTRC